MRFYLTKFREYVGFSALKTLQSIAFVLFNKIAGECVQREINRQDNRLSHKIKRKNLRSLGRVFHQVFDGGILHGSINCSSHAGPSYFARGVRLKYVRRGFSLTSRDRYEAPE